MAFHVRDEATDKAVRRLPRADNIGVSDRSKPLPSGGHVEQADGTAWMAFYCATMLAIALELAEHDPSYEDVASKFFEHFVAIADAMNTLGGTGLWDDQARPMGNRASFRCGADVPLTPRPAACGGTSDG